MTVLLKGGMVYQNHEFVRADVRMQDGVIAVVGTGLSEADAQVVDVTGKRLVPGFLDIHTHGAVGVDVNAAKAEDYEKICRFHAEQGQPAGCVLCLQIPGSRLYGALRSTRNGNPWNIKDPGFWGFTWKGRF